jgi:hypothetical protein
MLGLFPMYTYNIVVLSIKKYIQIGPGTRVLANIVASSNSALVSSVNDAAVGLEFLP